MRAQDTVGMTVLASAELVLGGQQPTHWLGHSKVSPGRVSTAFGVQRGVSHIVGRGGL